MNVKIQGGGSGKYANKGSCTSVVTYLQHEDMERALEGLKTETFFNNDYDKISSKEVTYKIDNNKAKLGKDDAKFYVLTISPSANEIRGMGKNEIERVSAFREYIRNEVMEVYANNFNKGLSKENIEYYAKIHLERGDKAGYNMHAHIIVSRKDISNKIKISPKTNHRDTKKGIVRGGFDRTEFYQNIEETFDAKFRYERDVTESFKYNNAIKNGSIDNIKDIVKESVIEKSQKEKSRFKNINRELEL